MSKLVHFEVIPWEPVRIIGKMITINMKDMESGNNPIPGFWDACFSDGTFDVLEGMREYHHSPDYLDWMGEWNQESGEFVTIVGMIMKPGAPVPERYAFRDLEATHMAVGYVEGKENHGEDSVYTDSERLTHEAAEEAGWKYDMSAGYSMEIYNEERFVKPQTEGKEFVILDIAIPVVK